MKSEAEGEGGEREIDATYAVEGEGAEEALGEALERQRGLCHCGRPRARVG